MFNRLATHRPPTIRNLSTRTRRFAIGAAAVIPALLIGVLGSTSPARRKIAASSPARTRWPRKTSPPPSTRSSAPSSPARAWPDLRTAGTAYVDLAVALHTARGTDGYETVWFYQRLVRRPAQSTGSR